MLTYSGDTSITLTSDGAAVTGFGFSFPHPAIIEINAIQMK